MQQAQDFLDESRALHALIVPLDAKAMRQPSLFKGWTFDEIIRHLHFWNAAAGMSLRDADSFAAMRKGMIPELARGNLRDFESRALHGLAGPDLVATWIAEAETVAADFTAADPKARLPWVGPEMSARSSITARLMESWAHGQAIWDALGQERIDSDRIANIVHIGLNTFGWTYRNRRLPVPDAMPFIDLVLPSGASLTHGDPQSVERISGAAQEFCQVVTQTRHIADTQLQVTGPVAAQWMAMAQCFAGGPVDPPAPGTRFRSDQGAETG